MKLKCKTLLFILFLLLFFCVPYCHTYEGTVLHPVSNDRPALSLAHISSDYGKLSYVDDEYGYTRIVLADVSNVSKSVLSTVQCGDTVRVSTKWADSIFNYLCCWFRGMYYRIRHPQLNSYPAVWWDNGIVYELLKHRAIHIDATIIRVVNKSTDEFCERLKEFNERPENSIIYTEFL